MGNPAEDPHPCLVTLFVTPLLAVILLLEVRLEGWMAEGGRDTQLDSQCVELDADQQLQHSNQNAKRIQIFHLQIQQHHPQSCI